MENESIDDSSVFAREKNLIVLSLIEKTFLQTSLVLKARVEGRRPMNLNHRRV